LCKAAYYSAALVSCRISSRFFAATQLTKPVVCWDTNARRDDHKRVRNGSQSAHPAFNGPGRVQATARSGGARENLGGGVDSLRPARILSQGASGPKTSRRGHPRSQVAEDRLEESQKRDQGSSCRSSLIPTSFCTRPASRLPPTTYSPLPPPYYLPLFAPQPTHNTFP